MKKYINILLTAVILSLGSLFTADAQSSRDFRPDRDYYGEEFDWRWDVRVRISDGINSGLITRWEANRLYRRLERIEEKEYAYAADGFYDAWEQDDVWRDVQRLHSRVGLELRDFDRTFYGFNPVGIAFTGYPSWWYNGGYNFYRFDHWGWGSIRVGYTPRCFVPRWVPNRVVYVNNFRNYGHRYYRNANRNQVVRYDRYVNNNRTNVTRRSRTSGRNDRAVYNNRNENNSRRGATVTPNSRNRSSSVNRSATRRSAAVGSRSTTPNRSTARTRTYSNRSESLNRSGSTNSRSREINRPTTRNTREYTRPSTSNRSVAPSRSTRSSREISRPSTSSRRTVAPSRSAGRSESLNRSSRSSSSRSTPNRSYNRSSSSSKSRSAVSRSSAGRMKATAASRSSSSRRRN